jgi:phospholipid/cholesterol/gamma-HCH transport system permease protein
VPLIANRFSEQIKSRLGTVQAYFALAGRAIGFIFVRPFYGQDLIQQMDEIGVKSLGIVLLTGFFTGMVLALQSSVQLQTFGATMYIGRLVSASMIRELGPVLAGLMVAGRVGSGIAAQLGSMRVTEQIDALNTLGTDPIKKLVTPRVLASDGFTLHFIPNDFIQGITKPFVFGGLISISACFFGLNTTGGTEGVGQSTTRTVVLSSILILIVDYFLTQILLSLFAP